MKNLIIFFALGMLTSAAQAETFKCSFTEPFLTITYSTSTKKQTEQEAIEHKMLIRRNVEFVIVGPGSFALRNSAGQDVATLELSMKGSDGMSENIYPYDIKYRRVNGTNLLVGGCESTLLPVKQVN